MSKITIFMSACDRRGERRFRIWEALKVFVRQLVPYGVIVWRWRTAHGIWIDWPLAYYLGWRKRFLRLIKFLLPFGLVTTLRKLRYGDLTLTLPVVKASGALPSPRRKPRPIRGRVARAVVVIPAYRTTLTAAEALSLQQTLTVLAAHEIRLVCPVGLDMSAYDNVAGRVLAKETFPAEYFKGISGYNRLMSSNLFYDRFASFDYMLICQLDAWVFSDQLHEWCAKGYDYVGAPWFEGFHSHDVGARFWGVGNGGFSLRRISRFRKVTRTGVPYELMRLLDQNEDFCYSALLPETGYAVSIPPVGEAMSFAFEGSPAWLYEQTGRELPFGCHAWEHNQFLTFYSNHIPYRMPAPRGKRLSVITVNLNNLSGLKKTADSVLAQTWRDFEWIVIDGGSTDGSKEYIASVLAPYVSYWCSEPDGGAYFGMNKGIAHAQGEYLNFMDSGDSFRDHKVLEHVFTTDGAADVIYGDAMCVSRDGFRKMEYPDDLPDGWFQYDTICHQAMFIRRAALGSGYDTHSRLYADWEKWIDRHLAECTFRRLPIVVCYNDCKDGLSVNNA